MSNWLFTEQIDRCPRTPRKMEVEGKKEESGWWGSVLQSLSGTRREHEQTRQSRRLNVLA